MVDRAAREVRPRLDDVERVLALVRGGGALFHPGRERRAFHALPARGEVPTTAASAS